jgi:hypothetical protein
MVLQLQLEKTCSSLSPSVDGQHPCEGFPYSPTVAYEILKKVFRRLLTLYPLVGYQVFTGAVGNQCLESFAVKGGSALQQQHARTNNPCLAT